MSPDNHKCIECKEECHCGNFGNNCMTCGDCIREEKPSMRSCMPSAYGIKTLVRQLMDQTSNEDALAAYEAVISEIDFAIERALKENLS